MKWTDKLAQAAKLYFMLVTFIIILLMILGSVFDSDRTLGYSAYASPLIYAAIGVLPVFLPTPKHELSLKGIIIKRAIELGIIETITLLLVFSSDNIPTENKGVAWSIAIGIVVIYIIVNVIEYLYEAKKAAELNELLKNL